MGEGDTRVLDGAERGGEQRGEGGEAGECSDRDAMGAESEKAVSGVVTGGKAERARQSRVKAGKDTKRLNHGKTKNLPSIVLRLEAVLRWLRPNL